MNKKYDDDFFEDLDKTTDLLKAFKPRMESKSDSLDDLFKEYMGGNNSQEIEKSEVDELTRSIQPIRTMKEAEELERQIKEQRELQQQIQREEAIKIKLERERELERQRRLKIEQAEASIAALFSGKSSNKNIEQEQQVHKQQQSTQINQSEKSDINDIISKMSVEAEKREQERILKEQRKLEKIEKKKLAKKNNVKFSKFEMSFCTLSLIFIIGCIWVFGIGGNKTEKAETSVSTLATTLSKTSPVYKGDGMYVNSGNYVFKGKDVNNYFKYSNMLWRVLKTNSDGTIDLVLNESINSLPWSNSKTTYINSDIHKYLNNYFIKYLDKDYLEKVTICNDEVNDLKSFSCDNKNNDSYVRLLTLEEFLDSKTTETYLTDTNSSIWLSTVSKDKVWKISGNNAIIGEPNVFLQVKPVIKLKANLELLSGNGTIEEPYRVSEEKQGVQVGSYIKLGNDTYVVYDIVKDKLKMANTKLLPNVMFNPSVALFDVKTNGTLGWYLNTIYYNTLSYKDLLVNAEWYNGHYVNTYENSLSAKVVSKIGILDVTSLKFDNELTDYYISNSLNKTEVLVYDNESYGIKPRERKNVRTTICILNKKVASGAGSKQDPYILEK